MGCSGHPILGLRAVEGGLSFLTLPCLAWPGLATASPPPGQVGWALSGRPRRSGPRTRWAPRGRDVHRSQRKPKHSRGRPGQDAAGWRPRVWPRVQAAIGWDRWACMAVLAPAAPHMPQDTLSLIPQCGKSWPTRSSGWAARSLPGGSAGPARDTPRPGVSRVACCSKQEAPPTNPRGMLFIQAPIDFRAPQAWSTTSRTALLRCGFSRHVFGPVFGQPGNVGFDAAKASVQVCRGHRTL